MAHSGKHEPRGALTRVRLETVDAAHAGRRLDNVLASHLKGAPRSLVYKLLRSGQVRVNGRRARADYRVVAGDELRIPPVEDPSRRAPGRIPAARLAQLEAAIVHEDARVIVIDKPSGLACHGGSGLAYGVIEIMRALRPGCERLDLGHRLDRETSGCLVLTKDLAALRAFHAALAQRDTVKHYLALLRGRLPDALERIDLELVSTRDAGGERRSAVGAGGKAASTLVEQREAHGAHTLVRLRLVTGRMHQIRAHARYIGHPVAGDRDYGDAAFNRELRALGLRRLFLHASHIRCSTPGLALDVEVALPAALGEVLARLDAGA